MRRSLILSLFVLMGTLILGACAPDDAPTLVSGGEGELQRSTTTLAPARIRLNGTSWIVNTINGAPVDDMSIGFNTVATSDVGRIQVRLNDRCGEGMATLIPTANDIDWRVAAAGLSSSVGCEIDLRLGELFVVGEETRVEVVGDELRINSGDMSVVATHFYAESVQTDEPEPASECTPRDANEFPTTIPGEWWCDE